MVYRPQLSLSAPSLFGIPFHNKIALLKRAGFSGIELFLFPYAAKHLAEYQKVTNDEGVRLSLHQPWSYKEGAIFLNRILDGVKYLPEDGYRLESLIHASNGEVFVAYCDRLPEVIQIEQSGHPIAVAFQTACCWDGEGESRTHRMTYKDFIDVILPTTTPIVFDTFHVLEWRLGAAGGKALAAYSEDELAEELLAAWRQIGHHRIIEIHWNDFLVNGELGGGGDGRACLPGDGVLAKGLRLLAQELKRNEWRGVIVPELSPFLLFPYRERTLTAVRERIEQFFR